MRLASSLRQRPSPSRFLALAVLLAVALTAFLVADGAQPAQAQSSEQVVFGYDLSPAFPYNLSVDEGVGTARVPITVSALPASSLRVDVTASDITAEEGLDYTFGSRKTVTFRSTDDGLTQFVEFSVTDDSMFEDEEFLRLNLTLPDAGTGYSPVADTASTRAEAQIIIVDNDLSATPTGKQYAITTPSVTAAEGTAAELTVTLGENAPAGGLTFSVTPQYCPCGANDLSRWAMAADVGTVPATVTVAEGSTTATLSIPIPIDAKDEADEHFQVTIATSAQGWSKVNGGNEGAVIITAATTPGDVTLWSDTLTVKTLDWGTGCGYRTAQPQCADALTDDDFTYDGVDYTVELVSVAYSGGTLRFILDKEPPPSLKQGLRLEVGDREFRVADALASRGIADRGEWTNRDAWVLSWIGAGLVWAEDDAVSLSLVTITDRANVAKVVAQPQRPVVGSLAVCPQSGVVGRTTMTVGWALRQSSNHAIYGYNTSTIAYDLGGTLTSQRFSHDGTVYEMSAIFYQTHTDTTQALHDTLTLRLVRPHTSSIRAALALHAGGKVFHFADADQMSDRTSLRWDNAGLSWSDGQQVELCVTVARVSLSVSPAPVPEGETATVTATLSRAVQVAVTIPVTMRDIAGQSGPDWAQSLVDDGIAIAAGQTSGSVALTVPWDEGDGDEHYRVILDYDNLPNTVQSGSPSAVSIIVSDDGSAQPAQGGADPNDFITGPVLEVSATALAVSAGGSATYTVKLGAPPTDIVIVTPTVADATRASVSPSQLVFSQADWNEAQTVTVSGAAAGETSIFHSISTQDPAYCCAILPTLKVTVSATGSQALEQAPPPEPDPPANRAPQVGSAISDISGLTVGSAHDVSLSSVFTDADGDDLTFSAATDDSTVADAILFQDTLTVIGVSAGTATVTVTAQDSDGNTVADVFTVRVKTAPEVASSPADVELEMGSTRTVSLSGVFTDADGDPLRLIAASSNDAVAAVTVSADQSSLTLEGASAGEATITLTARDPDGNEASAAFDVRVLLPLAPEPESTPAATLTGAAGRYDANGDGKIDHDEYLQATHDYDEGVIGILEMLQVRRAYLAGQG